MPYCPKCGYEYLPSATRCADCGEPLVSSPPAPPEAQRIEEPLVPVYDAPDEVMLVMARTVLQEAGISAVTQSGLIPWYDGVRFTQTGYHSRLLVFESQAAEAKRILAEYLAEVRSGEAEREALESAAEINTTEEEEAEGDDS